MSCKKMTHPSLHSLASLLDVDIQDWNYIGQNQSSNQLIKIFDGDAFYVVKFYRNSFSFKRELAVLLKCEEYGIRSPRVVFYREEEEPLENWLVYTYLEGTPLSLLRETTPVSMLYAPFFELGRELRKFHALKFGGSDARIDYRKSRQIILRDTGRYLAALKEEASSEFFAPVVSYLEEHAVGLENPEHYVYIIRDFNDKHFLLDSSATGYCLSGIIDFEEVVFSHRFMDFVPFYSRYFFRYPELESSFFQGYGWNIGEKEKKMIAFFLFREALELAGVLKDMDAGNKAWGEETVKQTWTWLQR